MRVGLDVCGLGVALGHEVRPEIAEGRRVVDDDDALWLEVTHFFVFFFAGRMSYRIEPPTIVVTARPRNASPTNGEFDAFDSNVAETLNGASRSSSVTSPGAPARSVPPGRLKIRAGPQDMRSISRSISITPARTSRS